MSRKLRQSPNPASAKKRLCWLLVIFLLALSLPVYLLLDKVYAQLETEAYFQQRNQAEILFERIQQRLLESIAAEEIRPMAEYSFFNILESPLLQSTTVKFSPLSSIPPKTNTPGLVGYFQINPDNSFHTPVLPDLNVNDKANLSPEELQTRIALKNKLQGLLATSLPGEKESNVVINGKISREVSEQKKRTSKLESRLNDSFYDEETDSDIKVGRRQLKDISKGDSQPVSPLKKNQKLSEEKLQELNINAERWNKNETEAYERTISKTESSYRSRKEKVKLPNQSLAGSLFNLSKQYSDQVSSVDTKSPTPSREQKNQPDATVATKEPIAIKIISFETEVSPLQMLILENNQYLCFYRQVWQDNGLYIQGFIVGTDDFFSSAIQSLIQPVLNEAFSSLILAYKGDLVQQYKILTGVTESLLYRASMSPPFQGLELIINSTAPSAGPGVLVIDLLAIFLGLSIIAGLLLFYRLAAGQIELAEQQRNFISSVSHELKTPLTSIRMYGEMLRSGWISNEKKKKNYYDYIFFESERLSRLIDNVLQLARLENHPKKNHLVKVDPNTLLQQIKTKTSVQIESSGFQLNLIPANTENKGNTINIDEDAFFQIMINLVDNAIKFSSDADNKIIDIGLKIPEGNKQAIFYVRDYGPGIDKKLQKKIFTLFYRAGNELTRTKPGTGIGLALIVQLADTMNAKIDLINRQPGVEFQLKFISSS